MPVFELLIRERYDSRRPETLWADLSGRKGRSIIVWTDEKATAAASRDRQYRAGQRLSRGAVLWVLSQEKAISPLWGRISLFCYPALRLAEDKKFLTNTRMGYIIYL